MNEDLVILMTEDDEGHATLMRRNLKRSGFNNPIVHFNNGEKLLNYLFGSTNGPEWDSGTPFVILLDIRMPKINGFDVLRRIKEHAKLRAIPVIIISTSDNPVMMEQCHELGCLNYIVKPVDYNQFTSTIRQLGLFLRSIQVPRINWDGNQDLTGPSIQSPSPSPSSSSSSSSSPDAIRSSSFSPSSL